MSFSGISNGRNRVRMVGLIAGQTTTQCPDGGGWMMTVDLSAWRGGEDRENSQFPRDNRSVSELNTAGQNTAPIRVHLNVCLMR